MCIKSANVYSGRIVSQKDDPYETLAAEMNSHYASERRCAVEVLKGELYAVQEENVYNRVRVIEVPEKGEQLFSSVTACFIDEGRTQEVKSHQLLQLPAQFQNLPGQAVEFILCRAQPVDGEVDWNPKVTRAISQKIKGKLHQARVVMSVGDTVWVDPMVRMTRVPGLKTYINEYNVHAEILASGFGVNNPQHVDLLKRVFQGDENANTLQHLPDDRVEVTDDDLTSKMKDLCSGHNAMEFNQTPISPQNNSAGLCNGDLQDTVDDDNDDDSSEGRMNFMSPDLNGFSSPNQTRSASSETGMFIHIFHPQIKWFQRGELVTVYIKLISPVMQKCEFYSDTVVYSGYVNDRHYYAKLELSGDIMAEECSWEMKCNEPVMKLKKKDKRDWRTLLKHKA
ncbi:ATP-dependent RNA helicase TDRD12 [Labeo rohita]|uniref:RNA helicase n=1 Tax=Labeo rohita TaxID=84645 RepID=A0A498LAS3_LABRO|nr:ATP-dependent RNA helicase TDRD12 [Labeo rohita]